MPRLLKDTAGICNYGCLIVGALVIIMMVHYHDEIGIQQRTRSWMWRDTSVCGLTCAG
jgi:hypothetical protein